MWGAAGMTLFSECYAGFMLFLTVHHFLQIRLTSITFAKILFSAFVMGATLLILHRWHILLLIPLGTIVYTFFLFGLGAISKETIREIVRVKTT